MAGKITALKIQQRNKERVNVFIDEEYSFAVTLMVAAELRKGQYLSDEDIAQLQEGDLRDKGYDKAIRFLSFRPRSQAEISRYLQDKGYEPEVVEDIIQRLIDKKYLDDETFAQFWLENRSQFKPRGSRALRYELRQKGIDDQVIKTTLSDLDEEELAWAAVQGKLRIWHHLPPDALQKKVMGFLSRRGFGYDVVRTIVERIKEL